MSKNLKRVAIVGGGFSGLSVIGHLLQKAAPLHIYLFEESDSIGPGVAFGTISPKHPLNVMASRMGAFADNENDFYEWLKTNESDWRKDPAFANIELLPTSFLPRKLYGLYLKALFKKLSEKNSAIEVISQEVVNINKRPQNELEIVTRNGNKFVADFLVLALGPAFKHFSFETPDLLSNPRFTHNIWEPHEESIFCDPFLIKNDTSQRILLIGSGLTAIDTVISLEQEGFRGEIQVVTKSRGFSAAHFHDEAEPYRGFSLTELPKECLPLLKYLKNKWKALKKQGLDWRKFFNGLKPITASLWQRMSLQSKKKFLRHLLTHWNRHRHRMSPESEILINRLQKEGRLKLLFGNVKDVISHPDRLEVKIECLEKEKTIFADHVINCAGQDFQIKKRNDLLLNALLEKKLIKLDDLALGLKVEKNEILAGDNGKNIFALGALLFGERFETTSVPEIRQQASSIADTIVSL